MHVAHVAVAKNIGSSRVNVKTTPEG
jgi:hypothetical protein